MIKTRQWGMGLVLSAGAWLAPSGAGAQYAPPPPPSQTTPPSAMMANPYLNPSMNPYLNPAATQQPMNANNALLYMYMAQQAKGGVGTGQLATSRPSAARSSASRASRAAEMPNSVSRPGGGAARYFNANAGARNSPEREYNQRGRYFMNNRR